MYSTITQAVELKINTLQSGVRTFAVDRSGSLLAAITLDGTLLIMKLISQEGPVRRQYEAYDVTCVKNSAVKKDLCRGTGRGLSICFQPKPSPSELATQLILAHQGGSPILLSRPEGSDDWEEKHFLVTAEDSDVSHQKSDVHLVTFSPNGLYLLTVDVESRLIVWRTSQLDAEGGNVEAIRMLQLDIEGGDEEGLLHMEW